MMTLRPLALITALAVSGTAAADLQFYLGLRGAGGDIDAPRLTTGTNLSTFSSLGTMLVLGANGGAYRIELEIQSHDTDFIEFFFFDDDQMHIGATMLNLVLDPLYSNNFRPFVGVGLGVAAVKVDIDNCYDFNGCGPNSPDTHDESTAGAIQYMAGFAYRPDQAQWEIGASYRWFHTSSLGLVTDLGAPFAEDRLEMSMVTLDLTWFF